jgi:hypothetical protein
MALEFDPHARKRMAVRGVTEEDVDLALRHQIRTRPGEPGSIWIDGYGVGQRIIPVCVRIQQQDYVITVGEPKEQGRRTR